MKKILRMVDCWSVLCNCKFFLMKKNIFLSAFLLSFISVQLVGQNTNRNIPAIQQRIINIDFSKTAGPLNTFFQRMRWGWQRILTILSGLFAKINLHL